MIYKGFPVKLFFSRFGKRAKWRLIPTIDLSLDYLTMMKHYQVRWTIEMYFKEAKQYWYQTDSETMVKIGKDKNINTCKSDNLQAFGLLWEGVSCAHLGSNDL